MLCFFTVRGALSPRPVGAACWPPNCRGHVLPLCLEDLPLFERTSFVVYFPLANFLAVLVCALIPELSVFVVVLPETNLFAIFERPRLKGSTVPATTPSCRRILRLHTCRRPLARRYGSSTSICHDACHFSEDLRLRLRSPAKNSL